MGRRMKKKKNADNPTAAEDNFEMDVNDQRFSAIFNNPKYNVDPSHPSFKKTKSMVAIIEEKQKRFIKADKKTENCDGEPPAKNAKNKQSSALISLANSI